MNSRAEKKPSDNFYVNNNIESSNSPQNIDRYSLNKDSESFNTKIKDNMNNISKIFSERLKKNVRENISRSAYNFKPEKEKNTNELAALFDMTKKILNKK